MRVHFGPDEYEKCTTAQDMICIYIYIYVYIYIYITIYIYIYIYRETYLLVAAVRVFGLCGTRVRLNACSAERVFGAVFGMPGVSGSGFTLVFFSVRQQANVCLVLGGTRVRAFGKLLPKP